jgi:Immunoglobulin I-set domain/Right handed beta helix region/S-layer homology domain
MRFASRVLAASVLICAAATATTLAAVIYVNAAATGSNNGSSWANAYTSLQTALGAANATDEIWVAAATYRPTGDGDRTVSFDLKNGVGIYGGFVGTETQRTERDPDANVTVLSGDIGTAGVATDNSFHVVTAGAAVTNTGRLDGFTVSGGQADGNPASNQDRGAGLFNNGGSPLIADVLFTGNFASFRGAGARSESGSPRFLSSTFIGNSVPFGAGGAGLSTGAGSVSIESCILRLNTISGATTGAGGIQTAGSTSILNTVVAQNSPNGVQIQGGGNTIQDSTFVSNNGYGVAFLVSTGNTISNSIVWNNLNPIFFDGSSNATVTYSDVQGGIGGTGNIDADPNFLSPPGDLRLGPLSPAVDAGNNAAVPGGVTVDIAGLPRFFDDPDVPDTGSGNVPPGIVDMGAYERIPITVTDPTNVVVCAGDQAQFTVTATGQPTLTYQWRKNQVNLSNGGSISGVTTTTLTINPTVVGDAGTYDVVVTDGFGQALDSDDATLTVNARPTAAASGGATICSGDSIQLDGSGGVACSWTPATGLDDANSCTPTASPSTNTTYNLTVTAANGCPSTNASSTTVTVNITPSLPVITAPISVPVGASGASASVPNHIGSTWTWTLSGGGVITAGQGSRQIVFDAAPPGTTMLCTVIENAGGCFSPEAFTNIQVDFLDVPPANPFHDFIVKVARNGVTAGCGGGNYCGQNPITRAQMAVFLLKSKYGSTHIPPMCSGSVFGDVPCTGGPFDTWIEELAGLGITGGCGGGNYCPNNAVTRAQMAVFLLKTVEDASYLPPPATGTVFADVPLSNPVAAWIEELYARNITGGCLVNPLRYCPNNANNRQQMAVFLQKTFNLP